MSSIIVILLGLAIFLIANKLWCFWSRSKVCLVGKTAIVTGAASGLGFEIATSLAAHGCRVIVADVMNITESVKKIIKKTHNPNITGYKVDLTSFKSVREFAKHILDTENRLDILHCNAGITETVDTYTEDGILRVMQINYLSHFLLTHLLLDLLKKSAPSRIIFTSSIAAYLTVLSVESLNPSPTFVKSKKIKWISRCYNDSKLACAAAAKMFGEKLKGTGVTANAVHPAGVSTPIFLECFKREGNVGALLMIPLVYLLGKSIEQGAQTLIHLAQSDEVKDITGQSFFEGRRIFRPFQLNNDEFCEKIWKESVRLTKLEPHEVKC